MYIYGDMANAGSRRSLLVDLQKVRCCDLSVSECRLSRCVYALRMR